MPGKIKLLVSLLVVFLVAVALTLTLHKPAQTGPPWEPLPTVWGYVTYSHENCDFSASDEVYIRDSQHNLKGTTNVFQWRTTYKYDFGEFVEPAGYYYITGLTGDGSCTTEEYGIYFDGQHTVRQDIDFSIGPWE